MSVMPNMDYYFFNSGLAMLHMITITNIFKLSHSCKQKLTFVVFGSSPKNMCCTTLWPNLE